MVTATTQTQGVPITHQELQKIQFLDDLGVISSVELLDVNRYSPDRVTARKQFEAFFGFYNMVKLEEYQKISALWEEFMDLCVEPSLLLNPAKYPANLTEARIQFEVRLMTYDCHKGVFGIFGKPGVGKTGFGVVHAKQGNDWFDIPVFTYKMKLPSGFGESIYINDEDFLAKLEAVTDFVEKKSGGDMFTWHSEADKEAITQGFVGSTIIIDEAHKTFPKGSFTRLGRLWYDIIKEWRHYQCQFILITHDPEDLNPHIVKHLTHEAWVSRNYSMVKTSDINMRNMETTEKKPLIHLPREKYYHYWTHNAPIAARSNIAKSRQDRLINRGI